MCTSVIEENGIVDGIYRLSGITSNMQRLRYSKLTFLSIFVWHWIWMLLYNGQWLPDIVEPKALDHDKTNCIC